MTALRTRRFPPDVIYFLRVSTRGRGLRAAYWQWWPSGLTWHLLDRYLLYDRIEQQFYQFHLLGFFAGEKV
jgi:hypothetical protein